MSAWVSGIREVRRDRGNGGSSHRLLSALAVVVLLIVGASQLHNLLPSIHNPFATRTVDRSAPVLLKSLTDLHTYDAAQGTYSDFVDIKREVPYVPSFLAGEDTQFLAVGSVDAGVDFSALDTSSITMSKDHTTISITLPEATLGTATVDVNNSRVTQHSKGLANRVGSLFGASGNDSPVYKAAQAKIAAAAAADPSLLTKAETNTRAMLATMLAALGYKGVTVTFVPTGL
jgi:hypothetical protein